MPSEITSKENAQIKYTKKLLTSSRFRKEQSCFVIEGIRLCEEAIKNGIVIEKCFYTHKCLNKFKNLISQIVSVSQSAFILPENIINLICDTDSPQGVVCVCRFKTPSNDKFMEFNKILLLEDIQNPSNLGSIFRTCDALGLGAVVISGGSCDVYNPKVLRGSMGAIFRLGIKVTEDMPEFIRKLQNYGLKIYAAVPDKNAIALGKIVFTDKTGIVLGNEGNGLSQNVIDACDEKITIPMNENAESLNVAVAAGISIWEIINRGNNSV